MSRIASRRPDPHRSGPERIVTVWCPQWPVVAAGTSDRAAIVLHANRVVACSAPAAAEGVEIGQRRREAQRACPAAELVDHDPDRDGRAFEPLVHAIAGFTARLDVGEPGCLRLAARGPARYFGGEAHLVELLAEAAVESTPGVDVRIGVADGRFASAVAARLADRPTGSLRADRSLGSLRVAPGTSPAFLAPLPVAWLHRTGELGGVAGAGAGTTDAGAELVGLFGRLGLHRLGDLAAVDPAAVSARFGAVGRLARQLAAGDDDRPFEGREPPPLRIVEHVYDDPVDRLEPLVFMAKHLADQLVDQLGHDGLACIRLVVTAETSPAADGRPERTERSWYRVGGLAAPAIVDRVRWHLAAWIAAMRSTSAAAFAHGGGVVLLRLTPAEVRPDDGHQPGLWGGRSDADTAAVRAVARLSGLLGDEAVTVPAWRGGYHPTDRYEWVPATTSDLVDPGAAAERVRPTWRDRDPRHGPWPGALPAPSPIAVHDPPRPACLTDATGRTIEVTIRGELTGEPALLAVGDRPPRPVIGWAGPWPVSQEWWDPGHRRRVARVQLVTDDASAFLAVVEHRRWWIMATYA